MLAILFILILLASTLFPILVFMVLRHFGEGLEDAAKSNVFWMSKGLSQYREKACLAFLRVVFET